MQCALACATALEIVADLGRLAASHPTHTASAYNSSLEEKFAKIIVTGRIVAVTNRVLQRFIDIFKSELT